MRRIFLTAVLCLTGCHNVDGPFAPRPPQRVDDPTLTIPEQKQRGAAQLPLPQESPDAAPYSGAILPQNPGYPRSQIR